MLFRILKKDIKRKKTMNVILLLFVILASMFVASGLSNVVTVLNGTEYYLDKAELGTYIIFTQGDADNKKLEELLDKTKAVGSYRLERAVYCGKENFEAKGERLESKGISMLIPSGDNGLNYFDKENNIIGTVEPGHVYVKKTFLDRCKLDIGDKLTVKSGNTEKEFVIDGWFKDAPLGSEMLGNERFLMANEDFDDFYNDKELNLLSKGKGAYISAKSEKDVAAAIVDVDGILFTAGRSLIKLSYIMSLLVAFIVLILSVALIIVAFVVLRFVINLSVTEDFREIGVMKAIGIRNGKIRGIYLIKYMVIAIVGTVLGGIASFPFGKLLIASVSDTMVLGNDNDIMFHMIGLLGVAALTGLFAWGCTRKIKKMSPVDAIRNGNSGERFKKKKSRGLRLKNHTERFLAVNDLLCKPKRYMSVFLSILICTLLVLTIVNTSNTMKSDSFAYTFGARGDLYSSSLSIMNRLQAEGKEAELEYIKKTEEKLAEAGMPCVIMHDIQYKYTISFEGNEYKEGFQQGIQAKMEDYEFTEGSAPQNKNEVAITEIITSKTGLRLGDTFTVRYDDHDEQFLVTAIYQTMNNAGDMILMHPDADTDFSKMASAMSFAIKFTDNPDKKTIEERKAKVAEIFETKEKDVMNAEEYCVKNMGVADTMVAVQNLLLIITLIVVILVTVLMERSFMADEKTDIALLKAVGFKNGSIIRWHMIRFFICSVAAVVVALIISIPVTHLAITPIFKMMGLVSVDYKYNPVMLVLYPGIICAFTVLVSFLMAQCTRTIKSSDTANIE